MKHNPIFNKANAQRLLKLNSFHQIKTIAHSPNRMLVHFEDNNNESQKSYLSKNQILQQMFIDRLLNSQYISAFQTTTTHQDNIYGVFSLKSGKSYNVYLNQKTLDFYCTCSDFSHLQSVMENHQNFPCKHCLAVINKYGNLESFFSNNQEVAL